MERQLAEMYEKVKVERERVRTETLDTLRAMLASGTLTADDLRSVLPKSSTPPRNRTKGGKVPPKYRNPDNGETWGGQGAPPVWIRDLSAAERERLLIPATE